MPRSATLAVEIVTRNTHTVLAARSMKTVHTILMCHEHSPPQRNMRQFHSVLRYCATNMRHIHNQCVVFAAHLADRSFRDGYFCSDARWQRMSNNFSRLEKLFNIRCQLFLFSQIKDPSRNDRSGTCMEGGEATKAGLRWFRRVGPAQASGPDSGCT